MSLPLPFQHTIRQLLGEAEAACFFAALSDEPSVSIRLNPFKPLPQTTGLTESAPIPWCATGRYLAQRPSFTFDPSFHAGCYYVQEASSMFLEQALRRYVTGDPLVMLDLCAAPGGKSTHARSLLPPGSLLVANEVIRQRSQILAENLTKWGDPDVVVTNNDPADFFPLSAFFDVVLADVPCSGEGMFRKDPDAVGQWSPENVELCSQRQRRIVSDIWPCLKPGGLFIYSTCTYNTQENEENIRWMRDELGAEVLPLEIPDEWHVSGNLLAGTDFPVYRFLPHRTRGEGFFLALLRKPRCTDDDDSLPPSYSTSRKPRKGTSKGDRSATVNKEQLAALRGWLCEADDYELLMSEGAAPSVTAFPRLHSERLAALRSALRILQAGLPLAERKGKEWQPVHPLAMSRLLNRSAFPTAAITREQAIAYLRKEAIVLPEGTPRGVLLLTCQEIPLGFVKNVGNRANNLYPQEWRIRN